MSFDTLAVAAIVLIAALFTVRRFFGRKAGAGCGCGCGASCGLEGGKSRGAESGCGCGPGLGDLRAGRK
jgi:hypothetical protein